MSINTNIQSQAGTTYLERLDKFVSTCDSAEELDSVLEAISKKQETWKSKEKDLFDVKCRTQKLENLVALALHFAKDEIKSTEECPNPLEELAGNFLQKVDTFLKDQEGKKISATTSELPLLNKKIKIVLEKIAKKTTQLNSKMKELSKRIDVVEDLQDDIRSYGGSYKPVANQEKASAAAQIPSASKEEIRSTSIRAASAASAEPTALMTVQSMLSFGETLGIITDADGWQTFIPLACSAEDGKSWALDANHEIFASGIVDKSKISQFKVVKMGEGTAVVWEQGANRSFAQGMDIDHVRF